MKEPEKLLIGQSGSGNVLFFQEKNEEKKPIVMYPENDKLFGGSAFTVEHFLGLAEKNNRTKKFLEEIEAEWFISILKGSLHSSELMAGRIKAAHQEEFGKPISVIKSERPLNTEIE